MTSTATPTTPSGTVAVGFRLGSEERGRQVTVLVTQSAVSHRGASTGGRRFRATHAEAAVSEVAPIPVQIKWLRKQHADYLGQGYSALTPPACVRLRVTEAPLHPRPWGVRSPRPDLGLLEAFNAAPVPARPRGDLEEAIRTFYRTLGMPVRPERPRQFPPGSRPPLPPRAEAVYQALGAQPAKPLVFPVRRHIGYTLTPGTVTLRVHHQVADLDHQGAVELQAALTAWLRHHQQRRPAPGPRTESPQGRPPLPPPPTPGT
ncbi:hypothetical protein [Streptomyces sp. NPDC051567]|uniref:hypothetical protein n=1 Tax=Streptomyces sp. NPDC051567 TaxID=3365660 RepID=UPI0037989A68